ncbi:hypothetical protein EBR43_13430 [bacterium]|nr:hypothetical protein [bacterium]NBW58745.1 hypothetical protein [bacterium]NBX71393.1 hypothetical protein [bacterium]
MNNKPLYTPDLNPKPVESIWLRFLYGLGSELYFAVRWLYLMLTLRKSFFAAPEASVKKKRAVVFVYGLFGNQYQFVDYKNEITKHCPDIDCYFYTYPHARSLAEDSLDFKNYLLKNLSNYQEVVIVGHSRGGIIGYNALEAMHAQQLASQYKLITLASPIHGSQLAYNFQYVLHQKSYLWVPVQLFLKFIFWAAKTHQVYHDLSADLIPKDKDDRFVYHIEANYDLIIGSLDKQHIKESTARTIINTSHPGLLFSKKAINTVVNILHPEVPK